MSGCVSSPLPSLRMSMACEPPCSMLLLFKMSGAGSAWNGAGRLCIHHKGADSKLSFLTYLAVHQIDGEKPLGTIAAFLSHFFSSSSAGGRRRLPLLRSSSVLLTASQKWIRAPSKAAAWKVDKSAGGLSVCHLSKCATFMRPVQATAWQGQP